MSNKSPKATKLRKRRQKAMQTTKQESLLSQSWKYIWAGVGIAATLMAFLVLVPHVSVTASDPVDLSHPFSSSILIANTGLLPLKDVYPSIALNLVNFTRNGVPLAIAATIPYGSQFEHDWPHRDMGMDDKVAFSLNDLPIPPFNPAGGDRLVNATIAVIVHYRLPVVGSRREKAFYLRTRLQTNGGFYWYPDANPN